VHNPPLESLYRNIAILQVFTPTFLYFQGPCSKIKSKINGGLPMALTFKKRDDLEKQLENLFVLPEDMILVDEGDKTTTVTDKKIKSPEDFLNALSDKENTADESHN
jgi:hypothetical protein